MIAQSASNQTQESGSSSKRTQAGNKESGYGGIQILSDTQGVDFKPYIRQWYQTTQTSWKKFIPDEVNRPTLRKGQVLIRLRILPSGVIMAHSMILEGSSGDVALDRAAWHALTASYYPALPHEFHGPYLELRALFLYNMKPRIQ